MRHALLLSSFCNTQSRLLFLHHSFEGLIVGFYAERSDLRSGLWNSFFDKTSFSARSLYVRLLEHSFGFSRCYELEWIRSNSRSCVSALVSLGVRRVFPTVTTRTLETFGFGCKSLRRARPLFDDHSPRRLLSVLFRSRICVK